MDRRHDLAAAPPEPVPAGAGWGPIHPLRTSVERVASRAAAAGELRGAARLRRAVALLFGAYALALIAETVSRGDIPQTGHLFVLLGAVALYSNRGGRFIRDWFPVLLALYAYALAGAYADTFKLGVHYLPQIDADKLLFGGGLPTVWLQHRLYHGSTGPLEIVAALAYLSHFFVPVLFAFYLWWTDRRQAFSALVYGLIAVLVLGEITFVLAPTAPPWMAAEHGLIPPVHDLLKQTLADIHLNKAASFLGNPKNYNTVAAMPSLHAAWPLVGFFVARRFQLPRWICVALFVQWLAIVFSIVYTGEHYVSDAIVGAVYAFVTSAVVAFAHGRFKVGGAARSLTPGRHGDIPASVIHPTGLSGAAPTIECVDR